MNLYDDMYEVKRAVEKYNRASDHAKGRPANWRSSHRMWDYVICKVCTGCGKPLKRYDLLKGYAFCFPCRLAFFPETISMTYYYRKKSR